MDTLNVLPQTQGRALGFVAKPTPPLMPPPGTIYFGAYVDPLNTLGPFETQTATLEQQLGRKLALHAGYYNWNDSFPGAPEEDDYQNGRVAVDSWDCGDTDYNVWNGKDDANIIAHAQAFRAFHHLVFLRWFWEMNLAYKDENRPKCIDPTRDVNGIFLASDFVKAWDHIRALFQANGATNVIFLWCISGDIHNNPVPYYPGPTETDWIGFDHYDLGNDGLAATMDNPYNAIQKLALPMIVAETGTPAQFQVNYLTGAAATLQSQFPQILGFMYYDGYGHRDDWRLSSPGFSAIKADALTTYMSAMPKYRSLR